MLFIFLADRENKNEKKPNDNGLAQINVNKKKNLENAMSLGRKIAAHKQFCKENR